MPHALCSMLHASCPQSEKLFTYLRTSPFSHGHEVGGTNPSLLRAMGASSVPVVIDVPFNREVVGDVGIIFTKIRGSLSEKITELEQDPKKALELGRQSFDHVKEIYDWDVVTDQYANLFRKVAHID